MVNPKKGVSKKKNLIAVDTNKFVASIKLPQKKAAGETAAF
ncbi:hypothetical protein [Oleidesulfovibrio sp.]